VLLALEYSLKIIQIKSARDGQRKLPLVVVMTMAILLEWFN